MVGVVKKGVLPIVGIIVALIIIVVLVWLLGSSPRIVQSREIISLKNLGVVGEGTSSFRHIPLGSTTIRFTRDIEPAVNAEELLTVARGILTVETQELKFDLADAQLRSLAGGKLSFRIYETNNFGILSVWLNDRLIWTGAPKTGEEVDVPLEKYTEAFRQGANVLKFSTTSSGWRIWSPSVYVLDRVVLQESQLEKPEQQFDFLLRKDEVEAWNLGRVVFTVVAADSTTDLIIKINNSTIWRGQLKASSLPTTIDFSKTVTDIGENNTVSFSIEQEGGYVIKDVEIIVFTGAGGKGTPSVDFTLTSEDIEALRRRTLTGYVSFKVVKAPKIDPLIVSVVGEEETILLQKIIQTGTVELAFTDEEVREGKNRVTFKSPGQYYLEDFSVRLVR